jgi:hypothetical protein
MSLLSGGGADKFGNRYEGRWTALQLLRLLAEEVASVTLEGVGDDETGVDLWVRQIGGSRIAYQCKRKNRSVGKWTLSALKQRDVFKHLVGQLKRDTTARFVLVSSDPTPELRDLCEAARHGGGDPNAFFEQVTATDAQGKALNAFCEAISESPETEEGRQFVFDLLRRTSISLFQDNDEGRDVLALHARMTVNVDWKNVVAILAEYAVEKLGHEITAEDVRTHLRSRDISLVSLVSDRKTSERIEELRREYKDSIEPFLIGQQSIPRPEATSLLENLVGNTPCRLLVLHGRAGTGKSCVFLQFAELLEGKGIPYLPLRLDRRMPKASARHFGVETCDLPESPAVVLQRLNPGRLSVLLVDQLDAVRWTGAHASAPWDACKQMLDEALRLPDVAVVVACRTFDLRDDPPIRAWHEVRKGIEVEIGNLPELLPLSNPMDLALRP